jgi:tRNA dimethylallyltransferase
LGPTASGKSEVAIRVAERIDAEIISVDSMQVYRGMDIGTAKPTDLERAGIVHHLIDVAEPSEEFSVAEFRRVGRAVLEQTDGSAAIICGGSGLHFRAIVDPMGFAPTDPVVRSDLEGEDPDGLAAHLLEVDPEAGAHVDMANPRRVVRAMEIHRLTGETPSGRAGSAMAEKVRRYVPEISFTAVGIDPDAALEPRINTRLASMREGGFLEEVRGLAPKMGRTARLAVGYRELLAALEGRGDVDQAFQLAAQATKRLARKQRTWFGRDPRIRWVPWLDRVEDRVRRVMEAYE